MKEVRAVREEVEFKDQLKIYYDPWDVYLHYDSKYFMQILFNNSYRTQLENIIIGYYVLIQHANGLFPYYDLPSEQVINQLLEFARYYNTFNL